MPVQNAEVAAMFDQGAELLEIQGENPFRVRPYRRAARAAWLALASRSWKRCVGGVAGFSMAGLSAAILTAASSNNIAKAIYAPGFGEVEFSRRSALMLFVLAILGFAAAAVYALPRSASSISNEGVFVSPAIFSNVLRSIIFRCRRSRLLMIPRVVKLPNALLTASSDIPMYSPISERLIGR